MKKIGFFINNTISKKNIDINHNNIKLLKEHFDDIYVIDNKNENSELLSKYLNNITNIIKIKKVENLNIFQKINKLLNLIDIKNSENITIILDEYIITTKLKEYFNFVNNSNYDLISISDSTELFYHLQINIFTIKKDSILFLKNIINDFSNKNKSSDFNLLYLDFLKDITNKISNKGVYCKTAYIESVEKKNIYLVNNEYYYYLLENDILPIISIKLLDYLINDYDKKEFVLKNIPIDFDIEIYRSYDDLKNFDDEFLKKHFLEHGQFECRKYKKNEIILHKVINDKLKQVKLLKYFDFPEDFDFYKYRDKNDDLGKLNKLDLKRHWINYGVYEDRSYN